MKRHVQTTGIRRWAGGDLVELQAECLRVIDNFFEEYGPCIIKGCEVEEQASLTPGIVALQGFDYESNPTFKVVAFPGASGIVFPVYLTLKCSVIERAYTDGKVKPIAYHYRAEVTAVKPEGIPYLEITSEGGKRFVDATGITSKLNYNGNAKDVTVTFSENPTRENVTSGEKLSSLLGKIRKFFSDLKAVAFSGKTADLTDDPGHRLTTDSEKARWNDTYTRQETDTRDSRTLESAKEYASGQVGNLGGDVYRKKETDDKDTATLNSAKEYANAKVETLEKNVYKKTETYTRAEIDSKDSATLSAAQKYVTDRIGEIIGSSPAALDTLYEIAAALGNDPNFSTTIMTLINGKAAASHKHKKSDITDFPSSMPASDVYAWAKKAQKPSYTPAEVGAAPASHNHDSAYAVKNHNHGGVYQPAGNYADASHKHAATEINEDATRRFMTDAERSKLAGIEQGANKYVHPSSHPASVIQQDSTRRFVTDTEKAKWNNAVNDAYEKVQKDGIECSGPITAHKLILSGNDNVTGITIPCDNPLVLIQGGGTSARRISTSGAKNKQLLFIVNYSGYKFNVLRNDNSVLATAIGVDCGALFYYNGNTWLPILQCPSWTT